MILNKEKIDQFIYQYPTVSNNKLYEKFGAQNDTEKNYIRNRKTRLMKKLKQDTNYVPIENDIENDTENDTKNKKNNKKQVPPTPVLSLTPESVEKLILDKLNRHSNIPDTQIRMALDFLIRLKTTEDEGMEQLDMEKFIHDTEG